MNLTRKLTIGRICVFTAFAMAFAWTVFLLIPLNGLTYGTLPTQLMVAGAMFAPTLANVLTRLLTREGFSNLLLRPNFRGNGKAYLLVYFGTTLLILVSGGLYFLLVPGAWDPALTTVRQMLAASPVAMPVGMLLLVGVVALFLISPVINLLPTLGEELGWRAYLLPKLRTLTTDRKAVLITGVIWGVWHMPIIALGHNYGTAYAGYPWLGMLAMVVFCLSLGVLEGYASIRLNSVIPAAMIHSSVNAGAGLPLLFAVPGYPAILGPAITGLLGGIPMLLLAVYSLWKLGRPSKQLLVADANSAQ